MGQQQDTMHKSNLQRLNLERFKQLIIKAGMEVRLGIWMKLFHVSVPLHLRLVSINAPFCLASEGQQILVDDLGSQAVASMLLGSLHVVVNVALTFEPQVAAFVGAGKWALAGVIHHVQFQSLSGAKRC